MIPQDLKNLYEEKTGQPWDAENGVIWLNKNYAHLDLYTKTPRLEKSAHITLSDKVSWLAQQFCHVCNPDPPISVIPLRIEPESGQSLTPKTDAHLRLRSRNGYLMGLTVGLSTSAFV